MRPLTICHFQQTDEKSGNLHILSHYIQKGGRGRGYGIFFLSCQNLPFLRFFLKSTKNDFWPEKWRIFFILFYKRWGNICAAKSIWKGEEKAIFSQKRVSKASNLIACSFRCFQIMILSLSNYTFDALLQVLK